MDKLESFKQFASKKPHLIEKVRAKETSWQELYEIYEIYGENHEIFNPKNKNYNEEEKDVKKELNLNNMLNALQSIDLVKVSDGLTHLKKIVDIFTELSPKNNNNNTTPEPSNKRAFRRYND